MPAPQDKLLAVFLAADRLNESFFMEGDSPYHLSVQLLVEHVQKAFGVTITFGLLDLETEHVFGFIERYGEEGKEAKVYIVKNITPRFKRLVGTKEISQIILDTPDDWRTDGKDTLERICSPIFDIDLPENVAVRSEAYAEVLSWELLYPFELRKTDLENVLKKATTFSDLAAKYGVPTHVIEQALSKPYMDLCGRYWDHIAKSRKIKAAE